MPTIHITIAEGRTVEQKRTMSQKLTQAVCDSLDIEAKAVDVIVYEAKRENLARGGVLVCDM